MGVAQVEGEQQLLALYDAALAQVYGYVLARCGRPALAEDLTAEVFLAAVDAARRTPAPELSAAWLIGTARHKLVDHWRQHAREDDHLRTLVGRDETDDPWEAQLDAMRAREVLGELGEHHRTALMLRYVDDLPVPQVAALLGRTLHATEALLVRARSAFRRAYLATEEGGS